MESERHWLGRGLRLFQLFHLCDEVLLKLSKVRNRAGTHRLECKLHTGNISLGVLCRVKVFFDATTPLIFMLLHARWELCHLQ